MNNILDKIDELIDLIKNSSDYKKYILLKEKIEKDNDIMDLINLIKSKQKEIVKLKSKKMDYSLEDKVIKESLDKLNSYPIYVEFNYIQEDLNILFQNIKNSIEKTINDIVN